MDGRTEFLPGNQPVFLRPGNRQWDDLYHQWIRSRSLALRRRRERRDCYDRIFGRRGGRNRAEPCPGVTLPYFFSIGNEVSNFPNIPSHFPGSIDEVAAFDHALSESDVQNLYKSATPVVLNIEWSGANLELPGRKARSCRRMPSRSLYDATAHPRRSRCHRQEPKSSTGCSNLVWSWIRVNSCWWRPGASPASILP